MVIMVPLDDEPYDQHLEIYDLGKCEQLAKKTALDYEIKTRDQNWKYKDGRKAREAIIRLWFS